MTPLQKIIKYGAIAFGTYLSVVIIGCIIFAITAIFGITVGIEHWQQSNTQEVNIQNLSQEYDDIENLKIDVSICKLTIQKGEKLKVEASNISKEMKCQVDGKTLKIQDKKMNMSWFNNTEILPEIIVYIPENLNKVEIKTGVNDNKIEDLNCQKLDIETGVGKTTIDGILVDSFDLEAGVGEVIFTGEIIEEADIDSGLGRLEVNLQGDKEDYQIKVKTGLGNFVVDNQKVSDNQIIGNGDRKVKINAGVGETIVNFNNNKI